MMATAKFHSYGYGSVSDCAETATSPSLSQDDHNVAPVSSSTSHHRQAYQCSFLRYNSFFLGTLFATVASFLDLRDAWLDYFQDDDDDDNDDDDDSTSNVSPWLYWTPYKILSVASTTLYLLDSLIHIFSDRDWNDDDDDDEDDDDDDDDDDGSEGEQQQQQYTMSSINTSQLAFSIVFGVAATLDLSSCVLDDEDAPWPAFYLETACVYFFLLSAVMTLVANHQCYKQEWILLLWGDLLFTAGCIVDVCVAYWDNPNTPETDTSWLWVASWSLVSSLLWLVDSLIYRLVDQDMFEQKPLMMTMIQNCAIDQRDESVDIENKQ